jgi:hypothetical protein
MSSNDHFLLWEMAMVLWVQNRQPAKTAKGKAATVGCTLAPPLQDVSHSCHTDKTRPRLYRGLDEECYRRFVAGCSGERAEQARPLQENR